MPDGSDPGRVERYTDRQVERVRLQVPDPNKTDILKTIRKGRRGNIPSPKRNQRTKTDWDKQTVRNNARNLRILAGEVIPLQPAEYDGMAWDGTEGHEGYPDRLLDFSPEQVMELITELSIREEWSKGTERDYCLSMRNLFLANDQTEEATQIDYPQIGNSNAAVDIETVPTREDLYALIDGENTRDKALYTTLWESGNRVTAQAAVKIKHWIPKGDGYGILKVPGQYVIGLKGAEYSAKPITFSRGFLDNWLSEHPRSDDPEAPLFCGVRSQDDPMEHLHPHSIATQLYRIARRTDGISVEHISPHAFKHGRASEMRASERYDKDDIEQILDWEEGTPMHDRYTHVTEEDEAERILRKHGFDPGDEERDPIEQHECPRCGKVVSAEADYCPSCALRQDDEPSRWWRIYRTATDEDDMVREVYEDDMPPASLAQLPPSYYDHAVGQLAAAGTLTVMQELDMTIKDNDLDRITDDVNPIDIEDMRWLGENYPEIRERQEHEYPGSTEIRRED